LRDAIRALQQQYGMVLDGHPSRALFDRIGAQRPSGWSLDRT